MWKLIVTKISEVSKTGNIEVAFDVYIDDEVKYPNIEVSGKVEDVVNLAKSRILDLKQQVVQSKKIKVGDEFTL
jgi:hypothetical protein